MVIHQKPPNPEATSLQSEERCKNEDASGTFKSVTFNEDPKLFLLLTQDLSKEYDISPVWLEFVSVRTRSYFSS